MTDGAKRIRNAFFALSERLAEANKNPVDFGEGFSFYRGEIHLIMQIGNREGVYASELAEMMGVTRAVVHKICKKLEERGLIYKENDPEDKKRKKLYLSSEGWRAYRLHEAHHELHDADFLNFIAALKPEEAQLIGDFLDLAYKMVDKHF